MHVQVQELLNALKLGLVATYREDEALGVQLAFRLRRLRNEAAGRQSGAVMSESPGRGDRLSTRTEERG